MTVSDTIYIIWPRDVYGAASQQIPMINAHFVCLAADDSDAV